MRRYLRIILLITQYRTAHTDVNISKIFMLLCMCDCINRPHTHDHSRLSGCDCHSWLLVYVNECQSFFVTDEFLKKCLISPSQSFWQSRPCVVMIDIVLSFKTMYRILIAYRTVFFFWSSNNTFSNKNN